MSAREQLHSELSLSSPAQDRLAAWRLFLESATALIDLLDAGLQQRAGISLRWYDVLVHLEEAADGRLRMNEVAREVVASKSGLTRVVDGMERAGLVRRERPASDRRVIEVVITARGLDVLHTARPFHRDDIERHFARHLDDRDVKAVIRALSRVRDEVRPLRAEQVSRS
jgi:DNA-binding MarR family transcriptional regulator